MPKPRATYRASRPKGFSRILLTLFLVCTAVLGVIIAYGLTIPLYVIGTVYKPIQKFGRTLMRRGVRLVLWVQPWLSAQIQVVTPRDENGKRIPCLTISNHRSYLDLFLLLAYVPEVRLIVPAHLMHIPVLGTFLRILHSIPIRQGSIDSYTLAMETCLRTLRANESVHVFPELRPCAHGLQGTNEFELTVFRLARLAGVPVVPLVFAGTDDVWPINTYGLSFRKNLWLQTLPQVDPAKFKDPYELRTHVRLQIDSFLSYYMAEKEKHEAKKLPFRWPDKVTATT